MSLESPASVLYDENGVPLAVTASVSMPANTSGLIGAGVDSTGVVRYLRMSSTSDLFVTGTVTANVSVTTVNQGNSGSINQSWYVQLTNGTNVIGNTTAAPVFISGTVHMPSSTTSSISSIPQNVASVVILSGNINRTIATIFNNANKSLYLLLNAGTATTTTAFSVLLTANSYFEVPSKYTGQINGIWASAGAGTAQVTEFQVS